MSSLPAGSFGSRPSGLPGGALTRAGIEAAEFAVRARITKRVDELSGGDFNLDRVRRRRHEAILRPRLATGNRQTDEHDQGDGGPENFHR